MLVDQDDFSRVQSDALYPGSVLAASILQSHTTQATVTPLKFSNSRQEIVSHNHGKAGTVLTSYFRENSEIVYDFAVPILRTQALTPSPSDLGMEFGQFPPDSPFSLNNSPPIYGLVQVGLSDVYVQREVRTIIWQILAITLGIIVIGITITILVTRRIITPLKALTHVAGCIMKGDLSSNLSSTTEDEIGELTTAFHHMTLSLKNRPDHGKTLDEWSILLRYLKTRQTAH